jgi:hypothetical protein
MSGARHMLCADTLLVRRARTVETEADGELIALDVETAVCYGLNPVAARVWRLLAEPVSVRDLRARLRAEFDVDEATCERELADLLQALLSELLIQVAPPAAAPP